MKKVFKVMLEVFLIFAGLALILIFLMFSAKSEIVPDIYVNSDSGKVAMAVKGGYKWNSFSASVVADSVAPEDYIYTNNNILLVTPGEKMTFKNSENSWDCYKFYQLEMKYYDDSNEVFQVPAAEDSKAFADLKYLELNAPNDEGTYIYNFKFSYYNKGEVSYGLKVVVSTEPTYEIEDLINYKNTKITDADSINKILNILPYSKYKTGIMIKTTSDVKELVINYDEFVIDRKELTNNIIALFTLIPELDLITYKTDLEVYAFTRAEIENSVGRNLEDYANDADLWIKEVLFKEKVIDEVSSRDTIYKAVITDIIFEINDVEINEIAIDTKSFKDAKLLNISEVDRQEVLDFTSEFSPVIYDVDYDEYKKLNSGGLFISLISVKDKTTFLKEEASGDIISNINDNSNISNNINEDNLDIEDDINNYFSGDSEAIANKYICTILVVLNNKSKIYNYEVEFINDKWNITEL